MTLALSRGMSFDKFMALWFYRIALDAEQRAYQQGTARGWDYVVSVRQQIGFAAKGIK